MFTALVLWTAFGSVFALLLGYSRIPYAAALDGTFFRVFGRLHPTKRFPHVSLLLIGVIAIAASTLSLGMVIDALITTRILVQFIGQVVALTLLRRNAPDMPRPFRMWLYPLPNLVALFGWIFLFATSGWDVIAFGLGTLAARRRRRSSRGRGVRADGPSGGGLRRRRRALGPGARAVGSIQCRQLLAVIEPTLTAFAFTALGRIARRDVRSLIVGFAA